MKDIYIRINRLGAVTNAEISLRPFMIFTGESGLGKSYVAFLVHYIYVLLNSDRLNHFFDGIDFRDLLENAVSGKIVLTVDTEELFKWINTDAVSYVRYMVGHDRLDGNVELVWPLDKKEITFTYMEELEGLADDEEILYSISTEEFVYNRLTSKSTIDAHVFRQLIQATLRECVFNDYRKRTAYVLPPSRGALLELSERPVFYSGMYEEFFNLKNALTRPLSRAKDDDAVLDDLLNVVNNGKISHIEGRFVYTTRDGIPMPLTAAASSVKELAPFAMVLKKFYLDQCSILFEEPEAHLHPQRQQNVADLIAYAVGCGTHMQITTHSDYFIKRLNVLLRLHKLSAMLPEDKKIDLLERMGIASQILLDPEIINAYYLSRRPDGSTEVRRYDIAKEKMIPFDSFEKTIMDDFLLSDMMDEVEFPEHTED